MPWFHPASVLLCVLLIHNPSMPAQPSTCNSLRCPLQEYCSSVSRNGLPAAGGLAASIKRWYGEEDRSLLDITRDTFGQLAHSICNMLEDEQPAPPDIVLPAADAGEGNYRPLPANLRHGATVQSSLALQAQRQYKQRKRARFSSTAFEPTGPNLALLTSPTATAASPASLQPSTPLPLAAVANGGANGQHLRLQPSADDGTPASTWHPAGASPAAQEQDTFIGLEDTYKRLVLNSTRNGAVQTAVAPLEQTQSALMERMKRLYESSGLGEIKL